MNTYWWLNVNTVLTLAVIPICLGMHAQDTLQYEEEFVPRAKIIEFTLDPLFPVNTFGQVLGEDLFGVSASYLVRRDNDNYDFWGFQFSWAHIGAITNNFVVPAEFGFVEVDERTGSNFIGLHGLYRYYPPFFFGKFEPFAEANFGTNLFMTTTSTHFFDETESTDFDWEEFDWGLSFGLSAGFTYQITGQFFFTTKFNYNSGNNITYLVPGEEVEQFPIDNFRTQSSQTNYLRWHIGLAFTFL